MEKYENCNKQRMFIRGSICSRSKGCSVSECMLYDICTYNLYINTYQLLYFMFTGKYIRVKRLYEKTFIDI